VQLVSFIMRTYYDARSPECQVPYLNLIYNRLPEDEPSGSKHLEDIRIKNYNINLENVHFVGFYCMNVQNMIQKIILKLRVLLYTTF